MNIENRKLITDGEAGEPAALEHIVTRPPLPPLPKGGRRRLSSGRRVWGLMVLCAFFTWSFPAFGAMIVLKDSVEVSTAVVLLSQVAEIHDADEAQAAKLGAVMLFPAPSAGRSKSVDFDTVRSRLASQGFSLNNLEFSGSSLLTVHGARSGDASISATSAAANDVSHKRADEMVTSAVREYLQERAPALGNLQVELNLTPKQISLLTAASSARVEISGGNEPWMGHQTFRAAFYDRPGHLVAMIVECRVAPLPQVLVAAANLPKGHIVGPNDVTWKQQPAAKAAESFLDREELVVGQETKRQLRSGEPIAAVDVRGIPLVRRGDIVTVIARGQGIVVRTDAKAQGDGSLGQPIKLLSLDGRRELSALVSGFHEATVPPASGEGQAVAGNGTGVRLLTAAPANQVVHTAAFDQATGRGSVQVANHAPRQLPRPMPDPVANQGPLQVRSQMSSPVPPRLADQPRGRPALTTNRIPQGDN